MPANDRWDLTWSPKSKNAVIEKPKHRHGECAGTFVCCFGLTAINDKTLVEK